jgi:glycosyltransferase involved in cell wall biosynthesis
MKILFVSHSYPPVWGGVESQNYNLAESLKEIAEVEVIANGKGKKYLPLFLPLTLLKMLFSMSKFDACLLGNGVLAPWGAITKLFHPRKKYICVVHGLDITFANKKGLLSKIYKSINIPSLKKMDRLLMVGNTTIDEAVKIGIPREKCKFIPNGINQNEFIEKHEREEISKILDCDVSDKKIIFRLARFVPHKGTSWFIKNVMPKLPENVIMVAAGGRVGKNTAGDKDDFAVCEKIIKEKKLEGLVRLFPNIPEKQKKVLLNAVDLVVSPNIKIPGTMEGFGINVVEAAVCGRTVVASALEGLKDAVKDSENGFLVESGNADAWALKIKELLAEDDFREEFGQKAKHYTIAHYSWDIIARRYLEVIERVNKS